MGFVQVENINVKGIVDGLIDNDEKVPSSR